MAWIESHQPLGAHPKTKRLARLLQSSLPTAVGHLHYLWWWALDFAEDGDLTQFSDDEIAHGALWEGDSGDFLSALEQAGFLDADPDTASPGIHLHDWSDYTGRLIEVRERAKERTKAWRAKRQTSPEGSPLNGREDVTHTLRVRYALTNQHNPTQPNPTEPIQSGEPESALLTSPPSARAHEGPPPAVISPPPPSPSPIAPLVAALLDGLADAGRRASTDEVPGPWLDQQTAGARKLASSGAAPADVRACAAYCAGQFATVTMGLIANQLPSWIVNGRPAGQPTAQRLPATATSAEANAAALRASAKKYGILRP